MITALGKVNTLRKSPGVNCVPMPNMMICMSGTISVLSSNPDQV